MLSVRLEEFQLFKVLRSTIDNHRDSGLHLLINLSRKQQIQLFATLGDELFATLGDKLFATLGDKLFATLGAELFATLGETSQSPAETKPHNIKTI